LLVKEHIDGHPYLFIKLSSDTVLYSRKRRTDEHDSISSNYEQNLELDKVSRSIDTGNLIRRVQARSATHVHFARFNFESLGPTVRSDSEPSDSTL
jgi:hypothetical protein